MTNESYDWLLIGILLATIGDAIYPPRSRRHAAVFALVWALAGRYGIIALVEGR